MIPARTRSWVTLPATFAVALTALGCARPQEPAAATPAEPVEPAPTATTTADPVEPSATAVPEPNSTAAPEPNSTAAPAPSFVALCNQMCDRVAKRCSETATDSCRMNCTQYEHPPQGCDVQVRTALECGAKAEDLTCVNIAPESCAPDFRRVVACAGGKPEGAMPEDPTKVPNGWQRYESQSGGFSTPMPTGVVERGGSPPTFSAPFEGSEYEVRVLEAPAEKPTQKSLVRVVLGIVGRCERNLKLFGMVEKPDSVTTRYESRCANGDERHGMLAIAGRTMHVLEIRGPKGLKTPKDPFFYGFELRRAR